MAAADLGLVFSLLGSQGHSPEASLAASLCKALYTDPRVWDALSTSQRGPRGKTHLMYHAHTGRTERLEWLLKRRFPPNTACKFSYPWHAATALHFASVAGQLQCVRALLAFGACPSQGRSDGFLPLHAAASAGHAAVVEELLRCASGRSTLDAKDENGSTPLMLAAFAGQEASACMLLSHGAGVNALRQCDGSTALILACASHRRGSQEGLVRALLDAGANAGVSRRFDGLDAITAAAEMGRLEVLCMLIGRGVLQSQVEGLAEEEEGQVSGFPKTPLMAAAQRGHLQAVRALCSAGVVVNARQSGSLKTALHLAAERGHCEVVRELVGAWGGSLELRSREGWTALFFAARLGQAAALKLLMELGADTSALDNDNDSARDIAASHGHRDVVRLLSG